MARWTATVEREAASVVSPRVRAVVGSALKAWNGELMPISRSWVNPELVGLDGAERTVASFAIVLAKAPFQVDEKMAEAVLAHAGDEARFVRILAWASFSSARRFTQLVAERVDADRVAAATDQSMSGIRPTPGEGRVTHRRRQGLGPGVSAASAQCNMRITEAE